MININLHSLNHFCALNVFVPGLLTELDAVLGPLNLMSSMTFMVRYTRQGVDWLRLDCQKGI